MKVTLNLTSVETGILRRALLERLYVVAKPICYGDKDNPATDAVREVLRKVQVACDDAHKAEGLL